MEYNVFANKIKEGIQKQLGEKAEVAMQKITKNNNVVLDGITIRTKNENISPTIYLNNYYFEELTEDNLQGIIQEIISLYKQNKVVNSIDINFFSNFENVKDKIAYKLINFDKNLEQLKKIPYIQFMDLAIVFYCLAQSDMSGNATIVINNSHIQMWGIEIEAIFKAAQRNTKRLLQAEVENIEDILREELGETIQEIYKEEPNDVLPMYVLSNQAKLNGAACILYKDVLKNFSKTLNSDLYVLPSSIHELILIPQNKNMRPEDLKEMVKDTNDNHVEAEEILSYSIYEYIKKEDKIRILL